MTERTRKASSAPDEAPGVEYRHNVVRGQHEIGVRVEGHFVPFAVLDNAVVAQRVENAASIADTEAAKAEGESK